MTRRHWLLVGGLAAILALLALAACSADTACVLGTRGWCENEMAALALRSVAGRVPEVSQADVVVVEDGFAVDPKRYGSATVRAAKPNQVDAAIKEGAAGDRLMIVISGVQVVNKPGPNRQSAEGTATVTAYQAGQQLWSQTVHGRLIGYTWGT